MMYFWMIGDLSESCVKRQRQRQSLCILLLSFVFGSLVWCSYELSS